MCTMASQVDELKTKGNTALNAGQCSEAIDLYTEAIKLDSDNAALFSNRSAAYLKNNQFLLALEDAERAIELRPDWAKAYSRKGNALGQLNRHEEAMMAYMEGLNFDGTNEALKEGIRQSKLHLSGPGGSQPLLNPFMDPKLITKLESDPRTKQFMEDNEFRDIIRKIQSKPDELGTYMQDSRVMTALGVALGADLSTVEVPPNSEESVVKDWKLPNDNGPVIDEWEESNRDKPADATTTKSKTEPKTAENKQTSAEALKEKELGNTAYKKRDFETAISHYSKAIELDPTNIVFRNNRAAVYFEQGEFTNCIKECEEGIEVGRENRADFKVIAKAFARIGNAYVKKDDYKTALVYFNKSLSEFRDQEIVKKAQQADKTIKERERLAYIDPEKSLEEKNLGNKCFTSGDFPSAIKHYSEAIKRNPDDAKLYSNRAACYTKLAEFNMALRDADECIRLDPKFVKGYLRKAANLVAMKEVSKAGDVYQKAVDLDPNCKEAIDGYRRCIVQDNDPEAVKRRAMQDPEVQEILRDPAMQIILQQMQRDPRALQEHIQNPAIAKKIEKLLEMGLIGMR